MLHSFQTFYCPECGRHLDITEYCVVMCECEEEASNEYLDDIEEEIEEICRSLDQ